MALDEALLEEPDGPPALRLYGWSPEALSLGYFQPLEAFRETLCAHPGLGVVRRPTGGGAIHHGGDWTFALTGEPAALGLGGSIPASYRRVHRAVARGLHRLGFETSLREDTAVREDAAVPSAAASLESDDRRGRPLLCFASAGPLDLMQDGRKVCGSAQRRSRGRLLHHGSLLLDPDPLVPRAAALFPQGADERDYDAVAGALAQGFAEEFGVTLESAAPEPRETDRAQRLLRERHEAAAWVGRR